VGDNAMETRRQQSEGRFADSKEQERINRESRTAAFEAGSRAYQSAYERASAGVNQALQSLSQLATSQETAALEIAYKKYERNMDILSSQLSAYGNREELAADEQNVARQVISDTRRAIASTENTIADLQAQAIMLDAARKTEMSTVINGLRARTAEMQAQIDQLLPSVGVTPGQPNPTGDGTGDGFGELRLQ